MFISCQDNKRHNCHDRLLQNVKKVLSNYHRIFIGHEISVCGSGGGEPLRRLPLARILPLPRPGDQAHGAVTPPSSIGPPPSSSTPWRPGTWGSRRSPVLQCPHHIVALRSSERRRDSRSHSLSILVLVYFSLAYLNQKLLLLLFIVPMKEG